MSSRPDTWMPMYWGDYLKDTGNLGTLEHGAYILLIGHYWVTGEPLPDDDSQLKNIAKLSPYNWKKSRKLIEKFFTVADGVWRHNRIDAELDKAKKTKEELSKRGKIGAAARWDNPMPLDDATAIAQAKPVDAPSPSPSPKKEKINKKKFNLDEVKIWARESGLTVSVESEYDKYLDYMKSKGRTHKDKAAGLRNWLRNAQGWSGDGPIAPKSAAKVEVDRAETAAIRQALLQTEIRDTLDRVERFGFDREEMLAALANRNGIPIDRVKELAA